MEPYSEHQPTGFDRAGAFLPDRQDWLVAPVSRTRDSDIHSESNFEAFLKGLGGEGDDVEVHQFGHWACGWYEIIIINPAAEATLASARDMEAALEDYPVLDEEDISNREHEAEQESWGSWGRKDFIKALKRRVEECWNEATDHGFTYDDIDHGFDLLTDEVIDALWTDASSNANWSVQHASDGPSFNFEGVAERIVIDEVIDKLDSLLWKEKVDADIRKLCQWMNTPQHIEDLAVSMQCKFVTQIRSLQLIAK
jgi:hypothetical protein